MMNVHRNAEQGELLDEFRRLRECERFTDVELVSGDGQRRRVLFLFDKIDSQVVLLILS